MTNEIQIRMIGPDCPEDIRLKNEPFLQYGRMIPKFDGTSWSFETAVFPRQAQSWLTFPDENYDYAGMKDCFFAGAYTSSGTCVGLAVYRRDFYQWLYLDDLKVSGSFRRQGIGGMLLAQGDVLARQYGYRGLYTVGQDDNLAACLFYIRHGFCIGGFDNLIYRGTSQDGKANIVFYRELPER